MVPFLMELYCVRSIERIGMVSRTDTISGNFADPRQPASWPNDPQKSKMPHTLGYTEVLIELCGSQISCWYMKRGSH